MTTVRPSPFFRAGNNFFVVTYIKILTSLEELVGGVAEWVKAPRWTGRLWRKYNRE
jgi:hypothetical protein